jgi:hypothetical protein
MSHHKRLPRPHDRPDPCHHLLLFCLPHICCSSACTTNGPSHLAIHLRRPLLPWYPCSNPVASASTDERASTPRCALEVEASDPGVHNTSGDKSCVESLANPFNHITGVFLFE